MFAGVLVTHLEVPAVQTLENFVNKVKTNYKKIPSLSTYIKKTSLRRWGCIPPQFPVDLVTFAEEILKGKLHFFCNETLSLFHRW